MKLQISKIKIGERFRKDFGNLEPLKKSIQEIGLLHPVVVNEDNVLVAGERRLRSVQELGWDEVPITRINKSEIKERLEKVVKGEHNRSSCYLESDGELSGTTTSVRIGRKLFRTKAKGIGVFRDGD
jgi:hypothetical protein